MHELVKGTGLYGKQLRDKLLQGEYTEKLIDVAIDYVKSYGYIDDRKYAEDYIAYHMENKNRKRMELDLYRKGIDRKLIGEILDGMQEEGEVPDELSMAKKILVKKNYDPETATNKEKQKISAFLYRKGFDMDIIRNVLSLDISSI